MVAHTIEQALHLALGDLASIKPTHSWDSTGEGKCKDCGITRIRRVEVLTGRLFVRGYEYQEEGKQTGTWREPPCLV